MQGEYDNSAVDLNRVRKLAGLPETGFVPPHEVYEPEHSFDIADEGDLDLGVHDLGDPMMGAPELDMGHDLDMDSDLEMAPEADMMATEVMPQTMPIASSAPSHWSEVLGELEQQMSDIPVGDFKTIIDDLRRLANYAEDIRRSLVTEGRKSFREYYETALAEDMMGDQTIGDNRDDAIKNIHARMGGKPADLAKAQQTFAKLQGSGEIKQQGGKFSMKTMDDNAFNAMVGGQGTTGTTGTTTGPTAG